MVQQVGGVRDPEREAWQEAESDLRANYLAAMDRLADIVANGETYTAAQVRTAVVDLARIQRRTLRLIRELHAR